MGVRDLTMLLSLAAVWGASFLFIRVGVHELGPFVLIDLRVLIAGFALLLMAAVSKHRPRFMHKWKPYLILGAFNAAIPFCLISAAEIHLSASLAAILNATTPMFTALVAWKWNNDPLTLKKCSGLLLGIIGVSVLVGWDVQQNTDDLLLSAAYSLLAALFYGIGGVYSAKAFQGEKPFDLAIGQQLAAGVLLIPISLLTLPDAFPSTEAIWSVLALAVLCTSVGYLLYFALMRNVGAVKTLSVTFLVPIFGTIWGAVFLDEQLSISNVIGLVIILLSLVFVANIPLSRRKKDTASDS